MKSNILTACLVMYAIVAFGQTSKHMTFLANWDDNSYPVVSGVTFNDCWGYVDPQGREYAIMGSLQKVHFFNVTNPVSPVLIDIKTPGATSIWRDFKTYGQYAYGVADQGSEGLLVFNLTNLPASVSMTANNTVFGRAHNIIIDTAHARLYVSGSNTRSDGLIVYDISNPAIPTLLASVSIPGGYCHDTYVRNNIAYCSQAWQGMGVFDFTNPTTPIFLGRLEPGYTEQGYQHSGWLTPNGKHIMLCDETHGKKLKSASLDWNTNGTVTCAVADTFVSRKNAPYSGSIPHNPFVQGNRLYVSYYHDGIVVFDVSDPTNIGDPIAWYDTDTTHTDYSGYKGAWGVYPYLPSGTIIGSDVKYGLFLVRLCDAAACTKPANQTVSNIGATTAKVQWSAPPCANRHREYHRAVGTPTWTNSFITTPAKTYTGLTPATTYQWRVKTRCDGNFWSAFSTIKTFTTLSALDAPANPTADAPETARLSPNPGWGLYTLDIPGHDAALMEVYDLNGRSLYRSALAAGANTLDLTSLPAGLYLLTVNTGTISQTIQLMRQ